MAHFAKVTDDVVVNVIVAEPEFFDTFVDTSAGEWIQTSYNTKGGVHLLGGTPMRKNFASIGYSYDSDTDAFYPPKPYNSWSLDPDTFLWGPPTPRPEGDYSWNEDTLSWVEVTNE